MPAGRPACFRHTTAFSVVGSVRIFEQTTREPADAHGNRLPSAIRRPRQHKSCLSSKCLLQILCVCAGRAPLLIFAVWRRNRWGWAGHGRECRDRTGIRRICRTRNGPTWRRCRRHRRKTGGERSGELAGDAYSRGYRVRFRRQVVTGDGTTSVSPRSSSSPWTAA